MARERISIALAAPDAALVAEVLERARRRGFRSFVVDVSARLDPRPGEEVLVRDGSKLVRPVGEPIPVVRVSDEPDLARLVGQVPTGGAVAVEWAGDRVIPLENVVAARGRRFEVWTYARSASEVPAALGALEHGANRVIVPARSPSDVDAIESVVEGPLLSALEWRDVPVVAVEPAGLGDRVIIDTTSLLRPSEGFLVGSAAAFLFHVASEATGSRFSRARPFRVNAGSAHSYVLMADGSTRYLAELVPGDTVLAVEPNGASRSVRVGRLKLERRPLVLVVAEEQGTRRTVFLQEAETVRLSGETARIATTELRVGAHVRGVRLPGARHLGQAVEETIEER